MSKIKTIFNSGNPNQFTGENMSNQCMYISIYHYLIYYHPDCHQYRNERINISQIKEIGEPDVPNKNSQFDQGLHTNSLVKIAQHYKLYIRVWIYNQKEDSIGNVGDPGITIGNIEDKEVNILSYGAHFQLITNSYSKDGKKLFNEMDNVCKYVNIPIEDQVKLYGFIGNESIEIDKADPDIKQLLEKEVSFRGEIKTFKVLLEEDTDLQEFEVNNKLEELIKFTEEYYDKKNKSKIISKYLLNINNDIEIYVRDNDNNNDIKNKIYFRFLSNYTYQLEKYMIKIKKIGNNIYVGKKCIFKKATNIYFIIKLNI